MPSRLARIADDAQKVVEAIQAAFGVDAEVVDDRLAIVAGTGIYRSRIGEYEEGGVGGGLYGRVLESGCAEAALDTTDPSYDPIVRAGGTMPEQADLAAPIRYGDRVIGLVALVAFTEEQAERLRARAPAILEFCERLGGLLADRLAALERFEALEEAHAALRLIQDHVDEGVALVRDDELLVLSGPAARMAGGGPDDGWEDLFLGPPPREGTRVPLYTRSGELLLADVRPVPSGRARVLILRPARTVQALAYDLVSARTPVSLGMLVGTSAYARRVVREVERMAASPHSVLITGEPGAGASTVAAALHDNGPNRDGPFVPVYVDAVAEHALPGVLFGGAEVGGGLGALALAEGGTLVLERVDRLPLRMQEALLDVLRRGRFPFGTKERDLACRVIATTTVHLAEAVRRGEFLPELFARLSHHVLTLPPLRRRPEDLPAIAHAFLERLHAERGRGPRCISPPALALLLAHTWPGNLRELAAVLEVSAARSEGEALEVHDLPGRLRRRPAELPGRPLEEMVRRFEASVILPLLRVYGEDTAGKAKVAERLGISLATLYRKLKAFGATEQEVDRAVRRISPSRPE